MADADWLRGRIRDVPDFPSPGILFRDLTPLLGDAEAFRFTVDAIADAFAGRRVDKVVGIEARGFILAAPVAYRLGAGFVPVRKPGKLPRPSVAVTYDLEYGTETLAVHADAVRPGARVLVVDDVLATGGTVVATADLVRRLGGEVVQVAVLMELDFLHGRARLAEHGLDHVTALISTGSA
jgi:adenine phosphoribosyltransferase